MKCVICQKRIKTLFIPNLIPTCCPECLSKFLTNQDYVSTLINTTDKRNKYDIKLIVLNGFSPSYRSKIEETVAMNFAKYNIKFLFESVALQDEKYFYIPDFFIPQYQIFIEVKNRNKDRLIKTKHFFKKGIRIFVFFP